LRDWRHEWQKRLTEWQELQQRDAIQLALPSGSMLPIGYIVLQHAVRLDRPVKAYERWIDRIPKDYREAVLGKPAGDKMSVVDDPNHLALLKHYRSLMPLAQEAHKPIFHLKPADGALGSHMQAVHSAYKDFRQLAENIAQRTNVALPSIGS
jgi:hypothetical protein